MSFGKTTFHTPLTAALNTTKLPVKTMHISTISISTTMISVNGWYTDATATVTIVDAEDNPVEGAMVPGSWSELSNDIDSGTTDLNGQASLNSNLIKNAKGIFTFIVDNVTKDRWIYDLTSNAVRSVSITVECWH